MKTSLLAFAAMATLSLCNKVNAQCTVTPPVITNIVKGNCNAVFDISFSLSGNNGNKVTAVYIFNTNDYNALPSNFYGNDNKVPSSAELNAAKALAVIKINTDSAKTVYNYQQKTGSTYEHPTSMQPFLQYAVDGGNITIRGISVSLINCSGYVSLKADVVSSQSPELTSVGCIAKGVSFSPNDPIVGAASLGCGSVRKVQTTFFTTSSRTIYFHMFKDVAPFGQITAADTAAANSVSGWYSLTTSAISENNFSANGSFDYTVNFGEKFNVWVVAYAEGVPNVSASLASNSCAPLPVSFRSFTAQRNEKSVLVKWETVTEQQNRGFNIQRQVGNSAWQNIGFVATQAANGNSSGLLSYSFTDANPSSAVSQYRIQQIDIDGKTSYSEIRSVRSDEISGNVVVYPNPSADGKITLSFDAATAKDVTISDMSGRVVKQFRNIRSNNLSIDNLNAGFYTVQVFDQSTAKTVVEKVVIKNH